ncbi:MAG: aminotransferase class IV [Bdellovibrionota bacterium]
MKELVAVNGEIYKPGDAKISVFDRGFLFGDAIYEVTRSYGRIFFQIEAHIERLYRSAKWIDMDLAKTQSEMIRHIYDIYKKIDCEDVYMRIQISRGDGPIGMSKNMVKKPNEVIIIYPFVQIDKKYFDEGAKIFVTERLRNAKKALDPNIKSGNYLNNVLAYNEGEKEGAFETFMVNSQGHVTEGTTSNIFMVKNNTLITPPANYDILVGITRGIVMEIAENIGLKVEEKGFDLKTLQSADEVFLTSSTREIVPVKDVNGKTFKVGQFEKTRKLIEGYKAYTSRYLENAKKEHPWR